MTVGANRHRRTRQRKTTDDYNHDTSWREPLKARRRRKESPTSHLATVTGRPNFERERLQLSLSPMTKCGKKLTVLKDAVVLSATAATCSGCLKAAGASVKQ